MEYLCLTWIFKPFWYRWMDLFTQYGKPNDFSFTKTRKNHFRHKIVVIAPSNVFPILKLGQEMHLHLQLCMWPENHSMHSDSLRGKWAMNELNIYRSSDTHTDLEYMLIGSFFVVTPFFKFFICVWFFTHFFRFLGFSFGNECILSVSWAPFRSYGSSWPLAFAFLCLFSSYFRIRQRFKKLWMV